MKAFLIKVLSDAVRLKAFGLFDLGNALVGQPIVYFGLIALFAILSYLLGSVNFAIVISKVKYHDDIRNYGSKNAGFTNMKRVYGTKAGVMALLGDILKNVVATGLALILFGEDAAYICGLCCILGHCYPAFYGFRGGKGVAASAAMIFVTEPIVLLIILVIFFLMTLSTKYLSVGSMSGALLYPILLNRIYTTIYPIVTIRQGTEDFVIAYSPVITFVSIFLAFFIVLKHRTNIKRIWAGTENKFFFSKKKAAEFAAKQEAIEHPKSRHNIDEDD